MLKVIKFILSIAILLVIAVFGATYYMNHHALDVIEQAGTQTLGATVTVGKVHFAPYKGLFEISGLSIANPEGFRESEALGVDRITFDMVPQSLFSSPIHIESFVIQHLRTAYEVNEKGQGNLQVLLRNLSSDAPLEPAETQAPESSKNQKSTIKLVIDHFSAVETTLTINLEAIGAKRYEETLPTFSVEGIGGQEGLPPEQLGKEIVQVVLERIVNQAQDSYKEKVKTNLKDKIIQGLGDKFKGLMDKF